MTPAGAAELLGTRVDATSYAEATAQILAWASERRSRYVCAANVHMVMEAFDAPEFLAVVNGAALVTPDGMPLVWALRRRGFPRQQRVYGPTLTLHVCEAAAKADIVVGFYGATDQVREQMVQRLTARFPGLKVGYAWSPPFRALSAAEASEQDERIGAAGVGVLFVGLGCPRQERWMASRVGKVNAVMLGVGAAFDFHAGTTRQAPELLQRAGLEWAFRLAVEPRRLWRRYLKHNPRFVRLLARQWLRRHLSDET